MHSISKLLAALALLASAVCVTPARAETYNTCAGFIDSLPTTITTQGVWCLNKNLSTAITSGNAITIATNNVTIDCNDFKIGGLAAGNGSMTKGIFAYNRQNATVRHCAIRGFLRGILLVGGAGHLVEDNRLDNNLYMGIQVSGDNNHVQRNRIYDTGGATGGLYAYGIYAYADVIDNTVSGVFATATNTNTDLRGIEVRGTGTEASGNRVRGVVAAGAGTAYGIYVSGPGITLADNRISAATATAGYGIYGGSSNIFCTGNTVVNFDTAYAGCDHSFGNLSAAP